MIWVIAGPTASGKSRLALELAQRVDAEIISADSQQVYREFDIGTAKPSAGELAAVRHHLVSCIDPLDTFSAARFVRMADAAIADITARGKRVVVVGGTGMYLRMLLRGVVAAPEADPALRARLEQLSGDELHRQLAAVDPVTAARLPVGDRLRMIRALEIHTLTGEAASARRARHAFSEARHPATSIVLNPPRESLYQAINARTATMFSEGLVEETRALVAKGYRNAAPMRAVGYVEALACVDGMMEPEVAQALVAQKTRHYAKRQLTWFRGEPGVRWLEPPFRVDALL